MTSIVLLLPWNPRTGLTEPNSMSFADGLFTSQHSVFVRFFYYSTATGVTAWPNIYYVFEGSKRKKKQKQNSVHPHPRPFARSRYASGGPSYWMLNVSSRFWLAQQPVAYTAHVFYMWTGRRRVVFPPYIPRHNPLAQYSWHYGTFRRFLCSFIYICCG